MKYNFFLAVAALLAGCNGTTTKTDAATNNDATAQSAPVTNNKAGTEITVTLSGGANAGTYQASSKESTCSMGLTGDRSFGNQYSETGKGEKELSSVQLMADDYDKAKTGTSDFNVQVGFGSLVGGSSYSLNPIKNSGTGTLTLTESGSAKIVSVEGITKEGVKIKAVITCKTVQKMVDGQLKDE